METKKKLTNAQLQKKIENSLVFVPKDKYYKSVFFDDKMLRLETTDDNCVITTGYHRHVFNAINPNQGGYTKPYLYTKKMIEIVEENDCKDENGIITYEKVLDVLGRKEDQTEYNIAMYYSWWLFNIFQPLYQIGESQIDTFLTYETYLHNIARSAIVLSEKEQDMTNVQFVNEIVDKEKSFIDGIQEAVLFPKLTDKEMQEQEIKAFQEIENERVLTSTTNSNESQN